MKPHMAMILLFGLADGSEDSWRLPIVKSHDVRRNPTEGKELSVVVLVTPKEQLVGCREFNRFLDGRWETYFVFEEAFVELWGSEAFLGTTEPTKGVHFSAEIKFKFRYSAT